MSNTNLLSAKSKGYDEFYTQLDTIEAELSHYEKHFVGKVVYCNCDDPTASNFFKFFRDNFKYLGLKRLITTCYKNSGTDLFSNHDAESGRGVIYNGDRVQRFTFNNGDGDFRSELCLRMLEEADIVVTNPPFSLFREYLPLLVKYNKKFLVLGNMNALSYCQIWPLFRDVKCWYGPSIKSGDRWFGVPDHYPLQASTSKIDGGGGDLLKLRVFAGLLT